MASIRIVRGSDYRQAQALATGRDCPERIEWTLTPERVLALPEDVRALVVRDGEVRGLDWYPSAVPADLETDAMAEAVAAAIRTVAADQAAKRAADEAGRTEREAAYAAEIEAARAAGAGALVRWLAGDEAATCPFSSYGGTRDEEMLRESCSRAAREAVTREGTRRRAAAKQREEAAAAARLVRLAALAAEHGDDSARERIAAGPAPLGLLPEEEALEIVRAARLPVSDVLREHKQMIGSDVCDAGEDEDGDAGPCGSVSFRSLPLAEVTAEEWARIKAVRAALAAAGLPAGEAKRHRGQCGGDCSAEEGTLERLGIVVEIDLGDGLVINREYAV